MLETVTIPVKHIGPVRITGNTVNDSVDVPLATLETPLWPSTNRGASVSRLCEGGIQANLISECMTRSIVLQADNASILLDVVKQLKARQQELFAAAANSSQHIKLIDCPSKIIGNLLWLRLSATTGLASGHNMLTKAAEAVITWLLQQFPALRYVSISGNFCIDKKVSAVNSLLGRGKYVVAEITIPADVCQQKLKTTPQAIADLNTKKNLLGSIAAGSLCSANAHFANMLYALYLATGQDVANIVEASQGITFCEVTPNNQLYFSVTLPNLIVGTLGNGKDHQDALIHLKTLGCEPNSPHASQRLAVIIAATVLCGELSLLAAQTKPQELMRAHLAFERGDSPYEKSR